MANLRVTRGVERKSRFFVTVDGEQLEAYEGETIAAVLLAANRRTLRFTHLRGEPRGVFCAMGICYDCIMVVDGEPNVRGCMTFVKAGMDIRTQHGLGVPGPGR
jgi:predicted molibdopterin-dependent oxidoreductase YjgC